ncbi:unnamed protein product, partial [Adineta steineri]
TYFIATNNFLKKSLEEILILKRYCPNILNLDLRGNPFDKRSAGGRRPSVDKILKIL